MHEKLQSWVNWTLYNELVECKINAPKHLLGCHEYEGGQVITAYRPDATGIEVHSKSGKHSDVMEMTSGEILDLIHKHTDTLSVYDNLKQIMELADFVKFAKWSPLPDENDLSMMNAYLFVNQTKIVEVPTPGEEEKDSSKENKDSNNSTE